MELLDGEVVQRSMLISELHSIVALPAAQKDDPEEAEADEADGSDGASLSHSIDSANRTSTSETVQQPTDGRAPL